MQQALQAQARPLTQQGVSGSKPMTQAAGRQVLDRTYFINELRQKRQQIINITARMRVSSRGDCTCCLMQYAAYSTLLMLL
jgi:hypothetical protein